MPMIHIHPRETVKSFLAWEGEISWPNKEKNYAEVDKMYIKIESSVHETMRKE